VNGEIIPTVGAIERMDIYLPLPVGADPSQNRSDENYNILVRLKPEATWAGAQADADAIATRIREQDRRHVTFGMTVTPLLEQVVGNVRQAILVIFGSVALVLLLIRSFATLSGVPPGFEPEHLLSLRMMLSGAGLREPDQVARFVERMNETLQQVPGIVKAGATSVLPFTPAIGWGAVTIEGYTAPPGQTELQVDLRMVTPDYFAAMGVPLKHGRFFSTGDTRDRMPVAVIDEKMARRFWPGESSLGKRLKFGGVDSKNPWHTLVGVVGDVKQYGLDVDGRMVVYFPHKQIPANSVYVVARSVGDPEAIAHTAVAAIRALDPPVIVYDIVTMEQRVFRSLARQRFAMVMLTAFAGFALLLATVGIYGVMSHLVSQRTRDIGIRMALGAEKATILGMIFTQGVGLATVGIIAGFVGASFLTRLMTSLLFGVSPSDLTTLTSVAALLGAVALVASYFPARRATRVDPLVALRDE
jgi:predicted permease